MTAELNEYERLERLMGRSNLLDKALTHSSASRTDNSQRLEFLGDAVIELAVRRSLFQKHPGASEGELTRMKIELVRGTTLARCAERTGLRERIVTGNDFGQVAIPDSMAADAYEAVAGALFISLGFEEASDFIQRTLIDQEEITGSGDPKSRLQEYCQARGVRTPEYTIKGKTGPPHAPVFEVLVFVSGSVLGMGKASSRKNAEMIAADAALMALEGEETNGVHAE